MKTALELIPGTKVTKAILVEEEAILNNIKGYMKANFNPKSGSWPNIGEKLSPDQLFNIIFQGSKLGDTKQTTIDSGFKGITPDNLEKHIETFRNIETEVIDNFSKTTILSKFSSFLEVFNMLYKNYIDCAKTNKTTPDDCFIKNYKLFMQDEEPDNMNTISNKFIKGSMMKNRVLSLYCFNPGFGFKDVLKLVSNGVIITSGTLSPIDGLESELKCKFAIKLENAHIIDKCQVRFNILPSYNLKNIGNSAVNFKFDMANRDNEAMKEALGRTIVELCKVTPGGILVFFTAFSYMKNCCYLWAERKILLEMEKFKTVFQDVQDSQKNKIVLDSFRDSSRKNKKGGILFSVLRGSCSEGIDYSDDLARLVIVVGIPFPSLADVKVQLKKEFLTDIYSNKSSFTNTKKITANDWYSEVAIRAVNQALGRVIRHVDDFGAMVLIDQRFIEMFNKKAFSNWLRDIAIIYDSTTPGDIVKDTHAFFAKMKEFIKEKKAKQITMINNNNNFEQARTNDLLITNDGNTKILPPECGLKRKIDIAKPLPEKNKLNTIEPDDLFDNDLFEELTTKYVIKDQTINKSNNVKLKIMKEYTPENLGTAETLKNKVINQSKSDVEITNNKPAKIETSIPTTEKTNQEEDKFNNIFEMIKNFGEDEINQLYAITSIDKKKVSNQKCNFECPVCFLDSSELVFKSGKCGHIICNNCWEKIFQIKRECPLCKQKVRKDKLIQVFYSIQN